MKDSASRLKSVPVEKAEGKTKDLYAAIKKSLGGVPNLFQGVGSSPAALEGYLSASEALKLGGLSFAERETIALVVSQRNECKYCVSAHSVLGKMAGIGEDDLLSIRKAKSSDPKLSALAHFAAAVADRKGNVTDRQLDAVRNAGYEDAQITEAVLVIALTYFTNFFNHVNGTPVDFPTVPDVELESVA